MKMKHLDKGIDAALGAIAIVFSGGAFYLYASDKLGQVVGVLLTAFLLLHLVRLVIKR